MNTQKQIQKRYFGKVVYVDKEKFHVVFSDRKTGVEEKIEGKIPDDVNQAIDTIVEIAGISKAFNCCALGYGGGFNATAIIDVNGPQDRQFGQQYAQTEIEAKFIATLLVMNKYRNGNSRIMTS